MASQFSDISKLSANSAALIKSAYQLNENKLYKMIGDIDDDTMHKIWGGLGLHISRQMRMGRGVQIHKFGLFTFGPTDFNKDGFASQKLKEKQKRQPVFLVSADFVKGFGLKQSIYSEVTQQLRPYSLVTSGQVQQVTVNFSEISNLIQVDPIKCKAGVNRMISTLASQINNNGQADLEIPGIGFLVVRNNMCGVNFHQSFIQSTQFSPNLPIDERKEKGEMTLTAANLSVLEYRNKFSSLSPEKLEQNKSMIDIASSANSYLRNNLGINIQSLIQDQKQIDESYSPLKYRNLNEKQKSISQINENQFTRDSSINKKNQPNTEVSHRSMKTSLSFQSEIYNQNKPMCQRIIQFWMRQNHLDAERVSPIFIIKKNEKILLLQQAFIQLCEKNFASSKNFQFIKLDQNNFQKCIQQNEIKLPPELIQEMFKLLDEKQKNYVDYIDWQRVFGEYLPSQIRHLDYIRDVIFKKGLRTDDILKTCKLSRDSPPLTKKDLISCMKQISLQIDDAKAEKISDIILQITGQSQISVHQLIQHLQSVEDDDKEHDPSWFQNLLWRLKLKFTDQELLDDLKQLFIFLFPLQQYDEHQQGLLDVASFKICLIKSKLKLSISEVNRMIRYLKKDSYERIDYFNFLQSISTIEATRVPKERIFDRTDFLKKLKNHYQQFESAESFLKTVHKSVKLENDLSNNAKLSYQKEDQIKSFFNFQKFGIYLRNTLFKEETLEFIESFVEKIDYSKDNFIDIYDIQQYIKNGRYLDQVAALTNDIKQNPMQTIDYLPAYQYDQKKIEKQSINPTNSTFINNYTYQFTTDSSLKQNEEGSLLLNNNPPSFPTNPLSEEMINLILRDLRKNIRDKKISFKQFFDLLDTDKNGMISCSEFMDNLDQDGFFAYIDKLHIGMIDLSSFLKVLEKSVIQNTTDQITEDNWSWQNLMVQKIYEWYAKGHFTSEEEAFRVIDFQYKGYIEAQDFKKFLKDVLKIKENELTAARVNRLFKIIDFYKSGRIGIIDFIKFIKQQKELQLIIQSTKFSSVQSDVERVKRSNSTQNQRNLSSSSSKQCDQQSIEILNFDWKKSVQQQLGLYISKNYPTISANFENVSQFKKKITFELFSAWVDKSNSLQGFDLTNTLMQELFAYLDPHKKGFLTESDWINQFGHINWKKQMIEELRNLIQLHFQKKSQIKEAFEFFLSRNDSPDNQKLIYLSGFYKGINYLYPKRFSFDEISQVWDSEINQFSQQGMDFNQFLGFIMKNFNSNNNDRERSSSGKTNNQIFQSQQNISKKIDIFDSKYDSIRYRSYTPIAVTGSKVSQSPKRQSRQKEQSLKQIIQGPKYTSQIKRNISDLKKQELTYSISQNIQPRLAGIKNSSFFIDKSDLNEYYNSLSKINLTSTATQQNQNSIQQNLSSVYNLESGSFLQQQGELIISKIKRIIRSSSQINLEEVLNKNDIASSGYLTNNQFKKALSELNLGLKSQEMFFLINLCGLDGRLQIKKFIELLQKSDEDEIIVKRCKAKLKQISSKIYKYMISPLDAFRQFNLKGDGKMNLQEFETVINKLQVLNGEPEEGLSVIKDMFGFLDRNQDGFIDSNEWNDVLSNLNTPSFFLGRVKNEDNIVQQGEKNLSRLKKFRSMSNNYHVVKQISSRPDQAYESLQQKSNNQTKLKQNEEQQQERNKSLEKSSVFRIAINQVNDKNRQRLQTTHIKKSLDIKDHDLILNILAKNRKYLQNLFQSYNQANIPITYELAKSLIMKILNSQGIQIADNNVYQFLKFAERDGIIDYRLLLEVYRDSLQIANQIIKH